MVNGLVQPRSHTDDRSHAVPPAHQDYWSSLTPSHRRGRMPRSTFWNPLN